ncbi:Flp family type IVb pilin [Arthrobacter sp. Alg241-R88]|jgi:pilus assembly protein Flp/PilA|uniref:Flp family type IVb pilin n=1 Tax=Arthrobacter sp. Alg241-R88 TaxID=2305984 RepID=UPI0013D2685B|nr:Flp family type IVb pilin [Arthrobacter sp. Alg241-R88]
MLSLYTNLAVRLQRNEKGATAVEYGIMVGLIAVVIIVAVSLLGGQLDAMFDTVNCQLKGGVYTPASGTGTTAVLASCSK